MNELKDSLALLDKCNRFVGKNKELSELFIDREYNFWQAYQPLVFWDIRRYIKTKQSIESQSIKPKYKHFINYLFSIVTALGVIAISIIAYLDLIISRRRFLVFSSDKATSAYRGDFRLAEVYKYLRENNLKFLEIFYTVLDSTFWKNLNQRARPAFYLESIDAVYALIRAIGLIRIPKTITAIDYGEFGDDQDFVDQLINKYSKFIPKTQFRIKILSGLLRLTAVRVFLCTDNVRRWNEPIAACRKLGIKTYAFQHGQFTKYQVGWRRGTTKINNTIRPDILFIWSEYWKNELIRLNTYFPESTLVIGGDSKGDAKSLPIFSTKAEKQNIHVLIPFEMDAPKNEINVYINKIKDCRSIKIFFKVRPDRDISEQLSAYYLSSADPLVEVVLNVDQIIESIDCAAGTQSTFLYDMIYYLKPILVLKTSLDYLEPMINNRLADLVEPEDDICHQIQKASKLPLSILDERKKKLYGQPIVTVKNTLDKFLSGELNYEKDKR